MAPGVEWWWLWTQRPVAPTCLDQGPAALFDHRTINTAIINNPDGLWKSEAGISLLRLELGAEKDKLELLSTASKAGAPRVQAWAIQEIARLGEKESEDWLRRRSATDDPLGRFAGLQLLLKGGSSNARK